MAEMKSCDNTLYPYIKLWLPVRGLRFFLIKSVKNILFLLSICEAADLPCTRKTKVTKRYNSLHCINQALKEQCREDFAVLGQFCAKIITLRLYS